MAETPSFAERRKQLAAKRAAERGETLPDEPKQTFDPSLIPQADERERSEEDAEMDRAIDSISILDAYRVWCGKMTPDSRGKTEGIMISCPKPDHPDGNPSAWINTDNGTWYCGGCDEGGDKYDIAALYYGYSNYKTDGALFHKLRRQMAEDFGYTVKKVAGGQVVIPPAEPVIQPEPEPEPTPTNVTQLRAVEEDLEDDEDTQLLYPKLDWRHIVPEDTFLREYMDATSNDDSPEEYHLFHGLMALGHACGRRVFLEDTNPVYGNMLVCILGGTGFGKSRSRKWLTELLDEVLPFNLNFSPPTGVKQVVSSGSGEHLIQSFVHEAKDPTTGASLGGQPVNGIVDYDEMERIVATMKRTGSNLRSILMGMGDANKRVSAGSLTGGERIAVEPFCTVATSTQPKALRALFHANDAGSGFLNRWVFVAGPPKKREAMGGRHSAIRVDLSGAKLRLGHVKGWGAAQRTCYLSDAAFAEWDRYFHQRLMPLIQNDETDLLKRLDLLHKRLMLLLTINMRQEEITIEVVKQAERFTDYLLACYGLLNENIGITKNKEIADDIIRHAKRHEKATGKAASTRDLAQYMKRKNYSPEELRRTIETLVAMDWLEIVKPAPGPGRKTVRYKVAVND